MGFWGGLLKGALAIGGAPFTGGATLGMLPGAIGDFIHKDSQAGSANDLIGGMAQYDPMTGSLVEGGPDVSGGGGWMGNLGKILGGNVFGAGASAAGSLAKGREAGRQSEFQNAVIRNAQDLRQRDFANESQSDAYRKAMRGALGMNVQDASINRPDGVPNTSMSGGLRPSAVGMEGREAAGVLNQQAMERLRKGEQFDELPGTKGNFIDTLLGTAGVIGGGVDGYKARQSADEQNSIIRKILEGTQTQAAQAPQASAAGSAGSVAPQAAPQQGPPLTPGVSTSWDWTSPDGAPPFDPALGMVRPARNPWAGLF